MYTTRGKIALTVAACLSAGAVGFALPAAASHLQNDRLEYFKVTQNNPTPIDRLIVKGKGCFDAEDMTKLRLVDYDPAHHKIIYRCIQP